MSKAKKNYYLICDSFCLTLQTLSEAKKVLKTTKELGIQADPKIYKLVLVKDYKRSNES